MGHSITCLHLSCPHCRARVVVFVDQSCITIQGRDCECSLSTLDVANIRRQARHKLPINAWVEKVLHEIEMDLIIRGVEL